MVNECMYFVVRLYEAYQWHARADLASFSVASETGGAGGLVFPQFSERGAEPLTLELF